MTEEIRGAITSDKVETDNTNFATVRADQTCEEVLLPRENALRQINWQVTLEKGVVYNPPEDVGIYAQEVDCKYGVQVDGDVFGRNAVSVEYGAASHDGEQVGARVFGSLLSEGQVDVVAPTSKLDDWDEQPVTVYGDVFGSHVTFEQPTVVYGSVKADQTLRTNAPTVVLGTVHSEGIVEATDLFAFTIVARNDITLGEDVAVVNPHVRSEQGTVSIADRVGVFTPQVFDLVRSRMEVETVGPWVFDVDAVWERNALVPADVIPEGDGEVATRSWRTVEELPREYYESVRQQFRAMTRATRDSPPDIEEFRYDGLADLGGDGDVSIEGDVVMGDQRKAVESTDVTKVDRSTTRVDKSTEVHDHSTTVEDSVVNRSDIGDETPPEDAPTAGDPSESGTEPAEPQARSSAEPRTHDSGEPAAPDSSEPAAREPDAGGRAPSGDAETGGAQGSEPTGGATDREPQETSRTPQAESREPRESSQEPRATSRAPREASREPREGQEDGGDEPAGEPAPREADGPEGGASRETPSEAGSAPVEDSGSFEVESEEPVDEGLDDAATQDVRVEEVHESEAADETLDSEPDDEESPPTEPTDEEGDERDVQSSDDADLPDEIEGITGVGPSKAENLRDAGYETVEDVRDADEPELAQVDGIGPALAARIKDDVGGA